MRNLYGGWGGGNSSQNHFSPKKQRGETDIVNIISNFYL